MTADKGTVDYILRHAEVEVVVCAPSVLGLLLSLISSGEDSPLSTIIVMDQLGQEVSDLCTLQGRPCVYAHKKRFIYTHTIYVDHVWMHMQYTVKGTSPCLEVI